MFKKLAIGAFVGCAALYLAAAAAFTTPELTFKPSQQPFPEGYTEAGWGPLVETHDGKKIYDLYCQACHTIGDGEKLGPDLAGVHQRRSGPWLKRWVKDPMGMVKTDPIGKALGEEWKMRSAMPNLPLSDEEFTRVLDYLRWQTNQLEAKAPAGKSDKAVGLGGQTRRI